MSNEEKEKRIEEALVLQDVFKLKSVMNVNHKPHSYMIGPKHIAWSHDGHYGGMLSGDCIREGEKKGEVHCEQRNCRVPFDDHTSESVAFLQCVRNCTNTEANVALKTLVEELGETFVDGFGFVESKFKIKADELEEKH